MPIYHPAIVEKDLTGSNLPGISNFEISSDEIPMESDLSIFKIACGDLFPFQGVFQIPSCRIIHLERFQCRFEIVSV